jgi:hypothetical protein
LDFVVLNRRKDAPPLAHDYDIIEGPVADDRISENITKYVNGKISREKFFKMLWREEEPTHQICFCTADSNTFTQLANETTQFYLKPWQEIYTLLKQEMNNNK